MKHSVIINFVWILILFFSVNLTYTQETTFYVNPSETDPAYTALQDSHFVAIDPTAITRDKLLFYMGGTTSTTKNTKLFLKLAANLGYHAVSVAYPNSTSAQSACGFSTDSECFEKFRQEACFGTPLCDSIDIDTLNSLNTRTVKLIQYLDSLYPEQGWGQFIDEDKIAWEKVVTSGHSQGSGHALYFSKVRNIDRCIMFSGANDYSYLYNSPANWISGDFITSVSRSYCFLHLQDETGFPKQYDIMNALGLVSNNDDSTRIDHLSPPYKHSNFLYTCETPASMLLTAYHNSTVVDFWTPKNYSGNPVFEPVWEYLLTTSHIAGPGETYAEDKLTIRPNPTNGIIYLNNNEYPISVYSISGKLLKRTRNKKILDITGFPNGMYLISNGKTEIKVIKQ